MQDDFENDIPYFSKPPSHLMHGDQIQGPLHESHADIQIEGSNQVGSMHQQLCAVLLQVGTTGIHQREVPLSCQRIKLHYLQHMSSASVNPGKVWNYSGEDLMQKVKRLAGASVHGNPPHLVHNKVMMKYVVALQCLLRAH